MVNKIKFIVPIVAGNGFKDIASDIRSFLTPYLRNTTELEFSCLQYGFSTVETELQGIFNSAQVVMQVRNEFLKTDNQCSGVFIDCFDNPGVYACREMGLMPVVGPYDAAISTALTLSDRIGIITTDEPGILNEERKAKSLGLEKRIVSITAVDLPVNDIMAEKDRLLSDLVDTCRKMHTEDRVTTVCLGCAAMFYVYNELVSLLAQENININVIEPTLNGILTLENMIHLNYNNRVLSEVDFTELHWMQEE